MRGSGRIAEPLPVAERSETATGPRRGPRVLRRLRARGGTGGFHGSAGWPGNNSLAFFTRSTGWRILFQLVFCVQVHVQPAKVSWPRTPVRSHGHPRPAPTLRTAGNPVGEATHANDTEETRPHSG